MTDASEQGRGAKEVSPVAEAIRAEVVKLATEGDVKEDGALTPEVLLRIMRAAKHGRELLMALTASPNNLSAMVRRPGGTSPFFMGNPDDDDVPNYIPMAPAPPSENFGMVALREIVSALKSKGSGKSATELVEALAVAREKGLVDVAKELEGQLMGKKEEPAPAIPAVKEGAEA